MVTISFKGSGVAFVDPSLIGFGQGLQVGTTKVNFEKGFVQLTDSQGRQIGMGYFSSLQANGSPESNIKSLVFKAKAVCTLIIGKASYDYINLNEWVTYNYISEQTIDIVRTATGQNPDVFDWQFFASDDPKFAFTIQRASRDSETEIVFPSSSVGVSTITQTINLRGAKKIKVALVTGAGAGNVTITAEYFDFASQTWISFIPSTELFNGITSGNSLSQDVGDTIQRPINLDTVYGQINYNGSVNSLTTLRNLQSDQPVSQGGIAFSFGPKIGTVLPSGDNVFRFKAVIAGANLTFSLGVTKVFD